MKKIILTLVLIMSFAFTYGQTKWHEKQNKHFVEEAAKEYSLNESQQKELSENRMVMVKSFMDSNKAFKSGEITEDQKKEKNRESSKTFNGYFSQLVGKPYKEVAPFMARMRKELKNL
ncbi:hypothetical protein [Seonamhaeicola maritimus]|uniref:DUF4890 domain-containing protein n=1 Tax=Seonamhaeicola maritimus TaxID=2591822 RepID=A0A5C7GFA3_9FLAO|nr:hypothetical protein [Seonamhaeicola maritimus]TXG35150.1 hypothetical protein FUA22_15460 [Seonamhaeicola maritimus]